MYYDPSLRAFVPSCLRPLSVHFTALALVTGLLCLTGCSSDSPSDSVTRLSGPDADALNAQHSRFDTTQDTPIAAETHFAAAQLAEAQANSQSAIHQYRQALKLDPHHRRSLYRLAVLYAQLQSYPEAIATWQAYLKETDSDPTALANLGFCHELAGQPAQAEAAYKQGLAKDPKNNPCRINYGLFLARNSRPNEAILQFQAVLTEAQAHYNLASVYEQLGRKADAKSEYKLATQLDPNLKEAHSRLAGLD